MKASKFLKLKLTAAEKRILAEIDDKYFDELAIEDPMFNPHKEAADGAFVAPYGKPDYETGLVYPFRANTYWEKTLMWFEYNEEVFKRILMPRIEAFAKRSDFRWFDLANILASLIKASDKHLPSLNAKEWLARQQELQDIIDNYTEDLRTKKLHYSDRRAFKRAIREAQEEQEKLYAVGYKEGGV